MGENINVLAENVLTVNLSSTVKDTTSENEALQLDICAYKERKWHDVLITKSYVFGGGANNIINDCTQQGILICAKSKIERNIDGIIASVTDNKISSCTNCGILCHNTTLSGKIKATGNTFSQNKKILLEFKKLYLIFIDESVILWYF